jgi:hypothetical protein
VATLDHRLQIRRRRGIHLAGALLGATDAKHDGLAGFLLDHQGLDHLGAHV